MLVRRVAGHRELINWFNHLMCDREVRNSFRTSATRRRRVRSVRAMTTKTPGSPISVDLRSDTVTRPTPAMREAMARAEVGDDVFGEDPTVSALEEEVARLTGKEAALFVSSGTMGNQLAIACLTRPGDEVIVGEGAHPILFECAAGAALSGVQFAAAGRGGLFTADEMEALVQPPNYWSPRTSLVCVENTHNRAGGRVFPQAEVRAIVERARARALAVHLDGARIWNASVATGLAVDVLAAPFDTVSVCFSKGLGAPVGSALCGPRATIERARRFRKMWGGGMRQVGILAAGALYALQHHRARLVDDHANAKRFAAIVAAATGARVDLALVETNIVNVDLDEALRAEDVAKRARELGLGAERDRAAEDTGGDASRCLGGRRRARRADPGRGDRRRAVARVNEEKAQAPGWRWRFAAPLGGCIGPDRGKDYVRQLRRGRSRGRRRALRRGGGAVRRGGARRENPPRRRPRALPRRTRPRERGEPCRRRAPASRDRRRVPAPRGLRLRRLCDLRNAAREWRRGGVERSSTSPAASPRAASHDARYAARSPTWTSATASPRRSLRSSA